MKIYLSAPYSHPDPKIRESRFRAACIAAGKLIQQGHVVYSSLSHSHPIAIHSRLPLGWEYWQGVDEFFISVCDEVWVLCSDGWEDSVGIKGEIEIARKLKKPIRTLNYQGKFLKASLSVVVPPAVS